MEQDYWLGRKRAHMALARGAASAPARLIHLDLAGRYSVQAANCVVATQAPTVEPTAENRPMLFLSK